MHACIHTYMHAYIHKYIHACIHTYMHTYIHAYIHLNHSDMIKKWDACKCHSKITPKKNGPVCARINITLIKSPLIGLR